MATVEITDQLLATLPPEIRNMPGGVLQSSVDTLRDTDIYILGYNPGGEGGSVTVEQSIKKLPSQHSNAYLSGVWGNNPPGEHYFQRRLRDLTQALGYELKDLPGSNLIFPQSRQAHLTDHHYAELCWPAHELFLDMIRPKIILSIGNGEPKSAFGYLRIKYSRPKEVERIQSKLSGWGCKRFTAEIKGRPTRVVGIPHISRYNPERYHDLFDWIKEGLDPT